MKRIFCLVVSLLVIVVSCSGCGTSSGSGKEANLSEAQISEKLQEDFASIAKIKYKGLEAQAQVQKAAGEYEMEFTAPESLAGMKFSLSEEKMSIGYKSFQVDLDPNSAVGGAALRMIKNAIQAAADQNGIQISFENDAVEINSQQQEFMFSMKLDPVNGNFLNIQVPEEELDISFENFSFL